jgi:cardiolipin synthase
LLWILTVCVLNTIALVGISILEALRPTRAVTWLVIGLFIPILGPAIYFLLSRPMSARRRDISTSQDGPSTHLQSSGRAARVVAPTVRRMTGMNPVQGTVQVLTDGVQTYDAILHSLRNAKYTIDMEYYIYRDDHIGKAFTDTLVERARAGVQIRFLKDGLGSRKFPKQQVMKMQAAGIECRTFFPLRFPWISPTLNHRDHCKIVCVDQTTGFVGGINVGDEYTGTEPSVGPWRDTHLKVTGEGVKQLNAVFKMNWEISTAVIGKSLSVQLTKREKFTKPSQHRLAVDGAGEWGAEFSPEQTVSDVEEFPGVYVQTVESGPDRPEQSMRNLFFLGLTQATENIEITTPYYVPDSDITLGLKSAVARGVKVRLLVPLQPDDKLIGLASQTYYPELLASGVKIYQYRPGFLHAKVMTVDGEISIIGAANYDIRSFRLNYEVGVVMYSKEVAQKLQTQFEEDLLQSTLLTLKELSQQSTWNRTVQRGARLLAPLL